MGQSNKSTKQVAIRYGPPALPTGRERTLLRVVVAVVMFEASLVDVFFR